MSEASLPDIPLPAGWARNVKSAVLHVISLAHCAIVATRGWAANSINARVRLSSDNDQAQQEIELLREELRIKDARLAKIDPRRRPYYPSAERMAILPESYPGMVTRPSRPRLPRRARYDCCLAQANR